MKAYVGIDIGTTNSKALALSEAGSVAKVLKMSTPKKNRQGVKYFDLAGIERIVDDFIDTLSREFDVQAVSFCSVGESVVPVGRGRPLSDPLMWSETCTVPDAESQRTIDEYCAPDRTGIVENSLFALHKMLWMSRNLDLGRVDYWLPISSYLAYRKTGSPVWDTSQACRSFFFDVHSREWIEGVLEALGISGVPGTLRYMGTKAEEAGGIAYEAGGHDHIAGLYGIYTLNKPENVLYDSFGSAGNFTVVVDEEKGGRFRTGDFMGGVSCGAAFKDSQYFIMGPSRYLGLFLSRLMTLTGNGDSAEAFEAINKRIEVLPRTEPKAYFSLGGDIFTGVGKDNWNFLNVAPDIQADELVRSAYVYLNIASRMMLDKIDDYIARPFSCFTGGAITKNDLFMRYRASILGEPIKVLNTDEFSALGAAVSAIGVSGGAEILERLRSSLPVERTIDPEPRLREGLEKAFEYYRTASRSAEAGYPALINGGMERCH